jgi:hypothetical protein
MNSNDELGIRLVCERHETRGWKMFATEIGSRIWQTESGHEEGF